MIKAPFPYFGGKSGAAAVIWRHVGPVKNLVIPFVGSAAEWLACPYDIPIVTLNDADGFICNVWRAISAAPDEVAKWSDWPVNECVPAGTMIATPTGYIPVEEIRPGMTVLGERNGRVVKTTVIATKQSSASEFYDIGPLRLTGNHPVWTAEHGYREASLLTTGDYIGILDWPVSKIDLTMVKYQDEYTDLGNLYIERPTYKSGSVRGRNISGQASAYRASVPSQNRRKNAPGLLDTFTSYSRFATYLSSCGVWARGWLARSRTVLDSLFPAIVGFSQSYRWGRWDAGTYAVSGATSSSFYNNERASISTRPDSGNEGQASYVCGYRKDSGCQHRESYARQYEREGFSGSQGQTIIGGTQAKALRLSPGKDAYPGTQKEDSQQNHESQAGFVCRDWANIPLAYNGSQQSRSDRNFGQPGHTEGLPLQRVSLSIPLTVYNFQTTTHNYFANRILVHNCDLFARHVWLVRQRGELTRLLETDPDYYDAKIAGWWIWGACSWIGTGWCSGNGPWTVENGEVIGNAGQGVNRQLPHLGDAGQGVNRQLPHLGNAGQGVNRQLPHLGNAGRGEYLKAYMRELADKLHRARVACGDWRRVMGPSVTHRHGLTAVLLDPPYGEGEQEYSAGGNGDKSLAWDVWQWAIENGNNPLLRIAVCGYEDGREMPPGWFAVPWKARKGYQLSDEAKENPHREIIWFSPHCLNKHFASNGRVKTSQVEMFNSPG